MPKGNIEVRPFRSEPFYCPKCNGPDHKMRFFVDRVTGKNRIKVHCEHCHYTWTMATAEDS